ncbi:hypothetical protein UT300002_30470 [Clostridium perfringens]
MPLLLINNFFQFVLQDYYTKPKLIASIYEHNVENISIFYDKKFKFVQKCDNLNV